MSETVTGRMEDALGRSVTFATTGGQVIIRRGGKDIWLGPAERDLFSRLLFKTTDQAEAWTREHTTDDVVEAEIWCGWHRECANGPGGHIALESCKET